jgi:hypothetical protein
MLRILHSRSLVTVPHPLAAAILFVSACSAGPQPASAPPGRTAVDTDGGTATADAQTDDGQTDGGQTPDVASGARADDAGEPTGPEAGAPGFEGGAADAGGSTADAGPTMATARSKVIATLAGFTGRRVAIGVEDKDSSNPTADSDTMTSMAGTGHHPSFWSADWGFGTGAVDNRETIVQEGEKQWAQGAIVQYIYHACPPSWGSNESCAWTDVDGSSISDSDWSDLVTPGGNLYGVWIARLDVIARYFQELKDAGVAPLFRVLHEMNDNWVWWAGHGGQNGSAELYRITHDYLVNTKGLDNIIWVWNLKDIGTLPGDVTSYAPGSGYFDIAALDVYDQGYSSSNYTAMQKAAGGKPMGIAECEALPSPDILASQPLWSYVAMWPDFFSDNTTLIPQLFNDSRIVTLDGMPGWK